MSQNYYEILGVESTSSKEEIKAIFRAQILKYHPDKISHFPEKEKIEAEERSKEIINAYKILSDETARNNYDNELRQGLNFSNNMSDESFYEVEVFTASESTLHCGKHELKLKESILNFTSSSNEKTKERFIHKDSFQPLFNYFNLSHTRLNNLAYKKQEGQPTVILNDKYKIVADKMQVLTSTVSDKFDELDDGYNSSDTVLVVLNACKQILEEAQNDEEFNEHRGFLRTTPILSHICFIFDVILRILDFVISSIFSALFGLTYEPPNKNEPYYGLFKPTVTNTARNISELTDDVQCYVDEIEAHYKP